MSAFQRCDGCKYWIRLGSDPSGDYGGCRRFPPTIIGRREGDCDFPQTMENGWCGEYKDKVQ